MAASRQARTAFGRRSILRVRLGLCLALLSLTCPALPPFLAVLSNPVQALRDAETEWVPLGALQRWHDVFLGKLEKDPSFWKRLHD